MKTLNLVDIEKSDIKYKISKFPDGQQNIIILTKALYSNGLFMYDLYEKESSYNLHWNKHSVCIKSRLNNFQDLELIICTVASLRELGVEEIHLYTPYILGSRSDRKFEEGGNNYLKDVICPIINSLNFKTVTCIDPHSDVLEACLNNFKKLDNAELVNWGIRTIYNSEFPKNKFLLISPDAGANKKIYKVVEQIGYEGDIITCSKDRDTEGKLTKVNVPLAIGAGHGDKDMIIIDDICDGGATFINIVKELKRQFEGSTTKNKIYLIVTHSIFSKGTEELLRHIDKIYTTNSYNDYNIENIKMLNIF